MQYFSRPMNQIWILYLLEGPLNTENFDNNRQIVNWTATYRHDSDIVTPYGKFVQYGRAAVTTRNTTQVMFCVHLVD